jgi:hypothetical protein
MCRDLLPDLSFQIIMSGLPFQITLVVTLFQLSHSHRCTGVYPHTQGHGNVLKMASKVQAPTVPLQSKEHTPMVQLRSKDQAPMVQLQSKDQAPTVQLQREVQTPMAQRQSKKQASMVQLQRYLRKVVKVRSSRHGGQSSKSNSKAKIQNGIYVHLVNRL